MLKVRLLVDCIQFPRGPVLNLGWQKNSALPLGDLPDGLAGCTIGNLINLAVESKYGQSAAMFCEINVLLVSDIL